MRVTLTLGAERDLARAQEWYDSQAPGTGHRFLIEYHILAERLEENPLQFPSVRGSIRRAGFQRFPYGLFFRIRDDAIEVFACFHASRKPRRW